MKKNLERVSKKIAITISILCTVWLLASFIEINENSTLYATTGQHHKYAKINFFSLIGNKVHASYEMAKYEQAKGVKKIANNVVKEEKEETESLKPKIQHTDEDLELLAHIINAEGGGASWVSDKMCYYIGSVVLNRVSSKEFPDNLYEVITQAGQYSSFGSANWQVPITDRSYEVANDLLNEGSCLSKNVIYQAEFTQGSGIYEKVQNMYFCYR